MIKLRRRLKLLWGFAKWMEAFDPVMIAYPDNGSRGGVPSLRQVDSHRLRM